jgi:probable F420-dependent oxidoreductase
VARDITYGVSVSHKLAMEASGNFDADSYAHIIERVEELGYDFIVAADHVFVPPYWAEIIGDIFFEPFTLFSYLAARTRRIEMVFACMVVPYRQPFTTAKTIAAVDQLSQGRFSLGVVPGYLKEEFQTFGLPRDERGEMTNEFVRIMIELWTNESATYRGKYYSCENISIKPRCVHSPHVPIWVGGSSRNAMQRVAEFGNVWHPLAFQPVNDEYFAAHKEEFTGSMQTGGTTPDLLRSGLDYIGNLAANIGRDVSDLKVVMMAGGIADIRAGKDRVVDNLGRYLEAGATGFSMSAPGETVEECRDNLARFAEEVIPQL